MVVLCGFLTATGNFYLRVFFFIPFSLLKKGQIRLKLSSDHTLDNDKVDCLENMLNMHADGEIPQVEWLDRIVIPDIHQQIQHELKRSKNVYLNVRLPQANVPIIYSEKVTLHFARFSFSLRFTISHICRRQ